MAKTKWDVQPEGTVRPAWDNLLWVVGRTAAYLYDPDEGTCSCFDFLFRKKPGDRCRHKPFVEYYFWQQEVEKTRRRAYLSGSEMTQAELRGMFS